MHINPAVLNYFFVSHFPKQTADGNADSYGNKYTGKYDDITESRISRRNGKTSDKKIIYAESR